MSTTSVRFSSPGTVPQNPTSLRKSGRRLPAALCPAAVLPLSSQKHVRSLPRPGLKISPLITAACCTTKQVRSTVTLVWSRPCPACREHAQRLSSANAINGQHGIEWQVVLVVVASWEFVPPLYRRRTWYVCTMCTYRTYGHIHIFLRGNFRDNRTKN